MLVEAVRQIFTIQNILMMNVGLAAGVMIGAMPGLSVTFAITVLLTMTFGMDTLSGMYLLLGAYCGGMYGGSITAILINTPGTPNSICAMWDGYPLAKQGRAGDALKTALVGSALGGIISACALLFLAPQLAKIVYQIASPEYFALCIFGIAATVSVSRKNMLKGFLSALLGLLLSCVGLDPLYGTRRLIFGQPSLAAGFSAVTCMLGLYALAQVLSECNTARRAGDHAPPAFEYTKSTIRLRDLLKYWKTIIKSSVIGIVIGAIPGTGGAISSMFSYNEAQRASKEPEEFGKGSLEGIMASETGNNAVTGATLIPMLTLGIPGDSCMAVLLGALTMQGIVPGAALFSGDSVWVYALMIGLIFINILMFLQGSIFIRGFANISKLRENIILPCIVILCTVGGFAIGNNTYQVFVLIGFGLLGYVMKSFEIPIAPMTIALVLSSLFETNLRRSMVVSYGDALVFLKRLVCLLIFAVTLVFLFLPQVSALLKRIRKSER